MKRAILVFWVMTLTLPAVAQSFFSSSRSEYNRDVVVGAVEMKGRGIVNLVVVLEVDRPAETKIYRSDEYNVFLRHATIGAKAIALQVLLENSSLDAAGLKKVRADIDSAVSKYFREEAQKKFPNEAITVEFGIPMLYVSDPFDRPK